MPLYTFTCSTGHITERLTGFQTETLYCACGQPAKRSEVNRIMFSMPGPKGEPVSNYFEAASEAKAVYESTDDPAVRAATRPDIWRPAWYRARNKLQAAQVMGAESDRWADPDPHKSAREVLAAEL